MSGHFKDPNVVTASQEKLAPEAPQPLTMEAVWENVLEVKEHQPTESAMESQHALAHNVAEEKVWQRRRTGACCRPAAKRRM